jgi:NADPH-dependent 2,4-dienoyl-CoA reductase/sulfur reductase-like enzyme/rhodanese-related sulfurtransferase
LKNVSFYQCIQGYPQEALMGTYNQFSEKPESKKPRILIVGGVAGGASCAARARRLSENAEIIIFERGPFISFASCGLPYYVGEVIREEKNLLVATPESFKRRFNIEVKLRNEVLAIDREQKLIEIKNMETGETYKEKYDSLVLSPGSSSKIPPIPGVELPGIFTLRTIQDGNLIKSWLTENKVKVVAVIGGGAIGLETVENLHNLGLSITIIEMLPQLMPNLDPEIAALLQAHLSGKGIKLLLNDGVARFLKTPDKDTLRVETRAGVILDCGMVLLATGVSPEVTLARQAGLEIGDFKGIRVNDQMQTNDKSIWAIGDAVEVKNAVTEEWSLSALAGPASRQGRIAADVILGRESRFRGIQGTMVCSVLGLTLAATGLSEKTLAGLNHKIPFEKVYLHPGHHAGFYPGAKMISIKLLFSLTDGKILGVQAAGEEGVEKRIDVISMAIQKGSTVFDLEEAEMCYAPQFGSAKDPINLAGMVAANTLRGDNPLIHWHDLDTSRYFLLDVRESMEFRFGHVTGATNIPLPTLRTRLSELPQNKEIAVYCSTGLRSYYATRILNQNGFSAINISGGFTSYMQNQTQ